MDGRFSEKPGQKGERARVAVTMGDPSGIGPGVIVKALGDEKVRGSANFLVVGDKRLLNDARKAFHPPLSHDIRGKF